MASDYAYFQQYSSARSWLSWNNTMQCLLTIWIICGLIILWRDFNNVYID